MGEVGHIGDRGGSKQLSAFLAVLPIMAMVEVIKLHDVV
jgi:hypothetical protein